MNYKGILGIIIGGGLAWLFASEASAKGGSPGAGKPGGGSGVPPTRPDGRPDVDDGTNIDRWVAANDGDLPPGSVVLTGRNLPARLAAMGVLQAGGVPWYVMTDRKLDDAVKEEQAGPEWNLTGVQFGAVAVNPAGNEVKFFLAPPLALETVGERMGEIIAYARGS